MKKYLFIIAAAATCLLAACSKEKDQILSEESNAPTHLPGWTYISAQSGNDTKASVDGTTSEFTWNGGDQIAVYSGSSYHISAGLNGSFNGQTSAEFAFEGDIDAGRKFFAVYPASLVSEDSDADESEIVLTLPASYPLSQVQWNRAPLPMVATNAPGGGLDFKIICPIVRIMVKCIPKDTETIKITFPGKKVQGEFVMSGFTLGEDGIEADDSAEDGDDTITITDLGLTKYLNQMEITVPIPIGSAGAQEYFYVVVGTYDSYGNKISAITTPLKVVEGVPTAWAPSRKAARKVTANLPYFTSNGKTKRKVVFAPGNLQATITTKPTSDTDAVGEATDWRFAEHQYDVLGICDGNKFAKNNVPIDLFAWVGNSANDSYYTTDSKKYGLIWAGSTNADLCGDVANENIKFSWGDIFNGVTYPANTWRLPNNDREGGDSANEWNRLCNSRTPEGGSSSYVAAKASILQENGVDTLARGLILFPNNYTHPYGVKALKNYTREDNGNNQALRHWKDNVITLAEWDLLEKVGGCVFLPVAGARWRNSGQNLTDYQGDCAYWSDYSLSNQHAAAMVVSDAFYCNKSLNGNGKTAFSGAKSVSRRNGCAVRLIRDID